MRGPKSVLSLVLAVAMGTAIAFGVTSAYAASGGKAGKMATGGPRGGGISGQIESIDTDGKVLTIKEKGQQEIQVSWNDATKIALKAGKGKPEAGTVADLKVGEHVSVRGEKTADGKYAATSIWVHGSMQGNEKGAAPKSAK